MVSEGVGWHLRPYLQPGFMAWVEVELLAQVPQVFCQVLFLLLLELPVLLTGPKLPLQEALLQCQTVQTSLNTHRPRDLAVDPKASRYALPMPDLVWQLTWLAMGKQAQTSLQLPSLSLHLPSSLCRVSVLLFQRFSWESKGEKAKMAENSYQPQPLIWLLHTDL